MAVQVCVVMVGGGRNIHGHFYADQRISFAPSVYQDAHLLPNVLII